VEQLAEEGYSKEFGARNASRIIEEKIKSFFVDEVLFGRLNCGGGATVDWREEEYHIDIMENIPDEAEADREPLLAELPV
jgi:ATP-dependent Clp protease ATP-binding subunit ClpA